MPKIKELKQIDLNVYILSSTLLVNIILFFTWWPLLPLYLRKLGANDFQIGLSYTIINIAFTLFQVLGGILSDRFGRKILIVSTTFLVAPLYFISAYLNYWIYFLIFLVIADCINAIQQPSFISLLIESTKERFSALTFTIFELGITLGVTLGPFFGSILIKKFSLPDLIIMSSLTCFASAFVRAVFLRETHLKKTQFNLKELKNYFNLNFALIGLIFIFLTLIIFSTIYGPFITMYAKDKLNFPESKINLIFALGGVGAVIFTFLGAKIINYLGIYLSFVISILAHALCFFPWLYFKGFFISALFFMFSCVFLQINSISRNKLITKFTAPAYRSTLIGILSSIGGTIGAFSPIIGSIIQKNFGIEKVFILVFIYSLILIPLV
ncbi:MAG: MFS transporter, partial [Armatimonadetes bacterium]|nr:MFS transporter [Armatimonadota bacterium]